ncbi:MAG: hypothetical protein HWE27_13335 [Gammaproteobacteria bacterium]|nr:hypothetical protein [Gammaproteobacteria bacterium]
MLVQVKKIVATVVLMTVVSSAMLGCQSNDNATPTVKESQPADKDKNRLKFKNLTCSGVVIPKDIWALEAMLIEEGLINPDMPEEKKQQIIEDYIKQQKSSFPKCGEKK